MPHTGPQSNHPDFAAAWRVAEAQFRCDSYSIHGPGHWRQVEKNGLFIAARNGADQDVVQLFALFHDCCRWDDGGDPDHGPRAADFVVRENGSSFQLNASRLETLEYAIRHHTDGFRSEDPTIGACWDADRLDLGRVGMAPDARYMSTEPGKRVAQLGSIFLYLDSEEN